MTATLIASSASGSATTTKTSGFRPPEERTSGWGMGSAIVLAILFHAGLACVVLPGVPGSPVPAVAPLGPQYSSGSASVELVEEAPPVPSAAAPAREEHKAQEPELFRTPTQELAKKPAVASRSHRQPAQLRAPAHRGQAPNLGGGLVLSEPPYPLEALRHGWQGKVTLEVFVQEGRPAWVEVVSSSGHSVLDRSARQWALQHWKFPGITAGAFTEAVIFSLDGV